MTSADTRKAIIADLVQRLRPVCADWPQDVFDAMVEQLADITIRYDSAGGVVYDRRSTDRLVNQLREAIERSERTHQEEAPE